MTYGAPRLLARDSRIMRQPQISAGNAGAVPLRPFSVRIGCARVSIIGGVVKHLVLAATRFSPR